MEKFADKIICRLNEAGLIKDDPIIYKYGLMLMINEKLTALLLIILSIPLHKVLHAILYMYCFSYLREYIGGYHANTYWKCRSIYLSIYFVNLLFLRFRFFYLYMGLTGICFFILLPILPVEFPTKPLSHKDRIIYKKEAIKRIVIFFLTIIVFSFINLELSGLFCTVFISVSILAIIQYYKNKKKGGFINYE